MEWETDFDPKRYKTIQSNDHDCGIHTAIVMERLFENAFAIIDHTESQIPSFRRQICLKILNFAEKHQNKHN